MKVEEESEKAGLKLNIQKTKIVTSGSITSWQIDGEKAETATDFIFLGSKITANSDCSHEIRTVIAAMKLKEERRKKLLGRKAMANLDQSRNITLPAKVCIVKSMAFPVITYGCERPQRRLSTEELMPLNCGSRKHSRVPWRTRRPNQSSLKEINPEYSLEGLMLMLQYSGHLMQRVKRLTGKDPDAGKD